jgi:hypothetical protein
MVLIFDISNLTSTLTLKIELPPVLQNNHESSVSSTPSPSIQTFGNTGHQVESTSYPNLRKIAASNGSEVNHEHPASSTPPPSV